MPLTCVQPGLYIGTRDDAISFCSSELANCKLRIITVDSEPLVTVEGRDGVVTKYIHCLDEPEADLLSFFDECTEFISGGLESQENVIVHCWAGESRSCAVVLAHLMKMNQMSLDKALAFPKSVHSKVNPNSGFLEQLQLYEAMGNTVNKTSPVYKQYRLQLLASLIQSQQYVTKDLLSSLIDDLRNRAVSSQRIFKCRKCRLMLFSADYLIEHEVGHGHDSFKWHKRDSQAKGDSANNDNQCTSLFIEPTDWMLPLLEGSTEGKIPCPKCNGRLGSFNWAGMQCSCGQWVTPAFQFHKNRVDETWNAHPPANNHPS